MQGRSLSYREFSYRNFGEERWNLTGHKTHKQHNRPTHDDVIKWSHFPRYWPFVRGIHPSPVDSPHKGQWRGALMFSFICAWTNGWTNNRDAGDLRRHRTHYDVTVMENESSKAECRPLLWIITTELILPIASVQSSIQITLHRNPKSIRYAQNLCCALTCFFWFAVFCRYFSYQMPRVVNLPVFFQVLFTDSVVISTIIRLQ